MKKILSILAVITFTNFFCIAQEKAKTTKVKNSKTITTASGLKYSIIQKGTGKKPAVGDKVVVHYVGKLTNDTVFDTSRERGTPFTFKLGQREVIPGWDEGIALLQEGDVATFTIPAALGYGSQGVGNIPANSILIFEVELLQVIEALKPWNAKGKDTLTTAGGLKYIVLNEGTGNTPQVGDMVKVHYSGFLEDGKMFDSSVERGDPFAFPLGKGYVIKGWDEGIALLKKGSKAKLIVPYHLAYGERGNPPVIPAKATLVFDVELVSFTPKITPVPYDTVGKESVTTPNGLKYFVINKGIGLKAEAGKTVKVHYTGYFEDGKIFDSSVERGEAIEFPLGQGRVIKGWEEGIALMRIGDKLRLIIPYNLAYGEQGRPPVIPAKSNLIFDVELVDVK